MKKSIIIILLLILILTICFLIYNKNKKEKTSDIEKKPSDIEQKPLTITTNDFDFKMIKETQNLYKENYMISPLSMAYALSLLKEGAKDETKNQIDLLLNNYNLDKSFVIKDKISIANSLFIKNNYKNDINNSYLNLAKDKYDSQILFDDFKTTDVINNWVKNKTFNMIDKLVDKLDEDFVLGIANAIAIDVEWKNKFECESTREKDFTLENNEKMKTAMMNKSNDIVYIENKNAKGIIKDYNIYDKTTGEIVYEENDKTIALEYIAILPNTNIDNYINLLNKDELNDLLNSKKTPNEKLDIYYSIPKYTYDFNYTKFKNALINLGMKDAFNSELANFKSMLKEDSKLDLYVGEALHKTHIELSESGTKAAAVTAFMMEYSSMIEKEKEEINIEFNKPFIYIIKEKNKDNIWFFGTVYEPMKFEDHKCEKILY